MSQVQTYLLPIKRQIHIITRHPPSRLLVRIRQTTALEAPLIYMYNLRITCAKAPSSSSSQSTDRNRVLFCVTSASDPIPFPSTIKPFVESLGKPYTQIQVEIMWGANKNESVKESKMKARREKISNSNSENLCRQHSLHHRGLSPTLAIRTAVPKV